MTDEAKRPTATDPQAQDTATGKPTSPATEAEAPAPAPAVPQAEPPAAAPADEARPDLPPAARRALREAEERRRAAAALDLPRELGGRDGPEPVRYGDWEKKGIAIDF